ncbi:MAG: LPS export ABC transporter periplasmic protein LptC [Pseudomonadota bacterium]
MIFRSQDGYSTFIAWAKAGLYVGALMLLSTLFLFSSRVDVTDSVIYADLNVDDIIREQRISNPEISTTLDSGTSIRVTAGSAQPDEDTSQVILSKIDAVVTDPNAGTISVVAGQGTVIQDQQTVVFSEMVELHAMGDVVAHSTSMILNIADATFQSDGAVTVAGPFGTFDAGHMIVQRSADTFDLSFTGGVQLVYTAPTTQ